MNLWRLYVALLLFTWTSLHLFIPIYFTFALFHVIKRGHIVQYMALFQVSMRLTYLPIFQWATTNNTCTHFVNDNSMIVIFEFMVVILYYVEMKFVKTCMGIKRSQYKAKIDHIIAKVQDLCDIEKASIIYL